jgi:hypothetical protein
MGENRAGVMAGSLALADVSMMGMACPKHTRRVRLTRLIIGIGRAGAVVICLFARPAAAYRPFDGTDAAVADLNQVEIELQPAGRLQTGPQSTLVAPAVVYNYGFAERWEIVLQTEFDSPPGGPSSFAASGAFLKYVIQPAFSRAKTASASQPNSARCCPASTTIPALDLVGPASCRNGGTGGLRISTSRPT